MNMRRQRQLHQDAMHMLVFVELMYQRQQFSFKHRRREEMLKRFDPDILAGFFLIAYIDVRSRIIAHEHHRQPGRHAPAPLQSLYFRLNLFLHVFGDGFAVDDSRHELTPRSLRKLYRNETLSKGLLKHLDDMENWKGQQEERRFRRELLKRSYGPGATFC